MEVVSGDNWTTGAISRAKLQSNHHHQQTNIQLFTGHMPFLSPNQQCQSIEGKDAEVSGQSELDDVSVSDNWSYKSCKIYLWPLIAPGYLGGGLPCLSAAFWRQYYKTTIGNC